MTNAGESLHSLCLIGLLFASALGTPLYVASSNYNKFFVLFNLGRPGTCTQAHTRTDRESTCWPRQVEHRGLTSSK